MYTIHNDERMYTRKTYYAERGYYRGDAVYGCVRLYDARVRALSQVHERRPAPPGRRPRAGANARFGRYVSDSQTGPRPMDGLSQSLLRLPDAETKQTQAKVECEIKPIFSFRTVRAGRGPTHPSCIPSTPRRHASGARMRMRHFGCSYL